MEEEDTENVVISEDYYQFLEIDSYDLVKEKMDC